MGQVVPFRRSIAIEQCRRMSGVESLMVSQVQLFFSWARVVNRIWWGA